MLSRIPIHNEEQTNLHLQNGGKWLLSLENLKPRHFLVVMWLNGVQNASMGKVYGVQGKELTWHQNTYQRKTGRTSQTDLKLGTLQFYHSHHWRSVFPPKPAHTLDHGGLKAFNLRIHLGLSNLWWWLLAGVFGVLRGRSLAEIVVMPEHNVGMGLHLKSWILLNCMLLHWCGIQDKQEFVFMAQKFSIFGLMTGRKLILLSSMLLKLVGLNMK